MVVLKVEEKYYEVQNNTQYECNNHCHRMDKNGMQMDGGMEDKADSVTKVLHIQYQIENICKLFLPKGKCYWQFQN